MKKLITVILAVAAVVFAVSCNKENGKQEEKKRPVCTKIVFTVNSTGYSKEILDLFRINISGVDFNGEAFNSNWAAEYNATFTAENVCIDSAEDHCPFTIKVDVEKRGEIDTEASYAFPHTFYIQAEYYDAAGNKLDVSDFSPMASEKIDRVMGSYDDGTVTYKGKGIERMVRELELDKTYVFFRHMEQDTFGCTTKQ